jgi:hypothetical protein
MSSDDDKKFIARLKEKIGEKLDKTIDIKDSVIDKISDVKETTAENLVTAKELASYQASGLKSEGQFLKKIFLQKEMILMKTDAVVIVLRKLGTNEEFFELTDKLTKDGYRLSHVEDIQNFPLGFGFNYQLGSLYYFQHTKYV